MDDALDVESQALELTFPELRDLENARRTPDEWRDLFHRFTKQTLEWNRSGEDPAPQQSPEELDKLCQQFAPAAKRALIATGMPADKVEAMLVHQLALLYSLHAYHILFDDASRSYSLPYRQAIQGIDATIEQAKHATDETREIVPITGHTLLALQSTRTAIACNDRQFALLRVFEALRTYAADHDGKLPQQLTDVTEVPIPDDPVTGKAFLYSRDGAKAFLKGPTLRYVPVNYEITMSAAK